MRSQVVRSPDQPGDEWRVSVIRADTWMGSPRVHSIEEKVRLFAWTDPGLVVLALIFIGNLAYTSARRLARGVTKGDVGYRVIMKEYWPLQFADSWPSPVYRSALMSRHEAKQHQRDIADTVKREGIEAVSGGS